MAWTRETRELTTRIVQAIDPSATLKGDKIPTGLHGSARIDGVGYIVWSQAQARLLKGHSGWMSMRVMAECPQCGNIVAASRLPQHQSRRDHA